MSDKTDLNLDDEKEKLPPEHDDDLDPDSDTPDLLATPGRGKGVRRLNRVPLIAIGAIVLLAVVAISYTFISRQNQNAGKVAQGPSAPVNNTNAPPVMPTGGDYISPPAAPAETESAPNGGRGSAPATSGTPGTGAAAPVAEKPSEAYQNRLRMIQRLEEKKLTDYEMALGSEPSVSTDHHGGGAQQGNATASSAGNPQPTAASEMQQYLAAMGPQGGGDMGGGMGGGMGGESMQAANRQDQKRAFMNGTPQTDVYLNAQRTAAISPNQEIKAGTVIPGVMISGLNSDLPGQIIGQVRENVYDSASGGNLLIPAGARIVGQYDSGVTIGQERALVVWDRIIFPDSSSISLAKMPGADMSGYAGFNDQVNNHYGKLVFNALMLSTFSAGIQLSQPQAQNGENYSSSQIVAGSMGQQLGQLGMQLAQRGMNIQPTLEIRPGYTFNIMVNKDMILPNWQGHPMAAGQ